MLFGPRVGDLKAGVVVERVLGLRNLAELAPAAPPAGAPEWYGRRWIDATGGAWQEIDFSHLARDAAFLQVGLRPAARTRRRDHRLDRTPAVPEETWP